MNSRLLSGDCIAAACCLLARPQDEWDQTLAALLASQTGEATSKRHKSLMCISNELGRSSEPFWNDVNFCAALIKVLEGVRGLNVSNRLSERSFKSVM